ncbi:UDP-N-acetylglucosamine--N-acetylmuramyl-(pentapeptide) pyrophosphoryl-undecaprenol N-acetylglucosamine transferase [Kineosporia sp. J2-2]|uniref:UDP-N-acetylglucosamine--N-acetylmuramyl-(pentapeptide) pyrophosphoryl-undecaprenol N-acetylglucosamine transferase n=1 Tax=Kineosporia corallincola TaxID=2835133 RepID=A0ABS5TJ95_9ACTN|nr:UDP-N-acetylglucosamine--N-acetylmuramyl-(pentapeptide) pyrophosphoryl-undecaprenol N-acetylglucosamine transferase [Kineosporia corallincola]MBT0771085.1 UDP-N-acetylglucosamine--N-acetylmuramyl-(pentapeptide) pyrophosphoryl-undecaprenol N-acetylglucosamine transferase [Kineosporia corallincola]
MSLSVVLAGGGTTGHIAPLLALADCLRRRDPATKITALGTAEGLEARLVPAAGYDLELMPRVPMPRKPSPALLHLPGNLKAAIDAAAAVLEGADVLVGFGGYVSSPAYLAARRLGVPFVVHEANASPGLANKLGARFTPHVAVTFPGTPLRHAQVIGLPLRRQITMLDRDSQRETARVALGLKPNQTTLFVTGGSLGAQRLNETFGRSAWLLHGAGVQVLHTAGRGKTVLFDDGDQPPNYLVTEYLDRMDLAYAAADMVVCRSGAGNVSEVTALGLPAAYVPLPIGNGEQRHNAEPVVRAGGGLLVDNDACDPIWVANTLLPILNDPQRLWAMGDAAARFGIRDADERLASMVEVAAGRGGHR